MKFLKRFNWKLIVLHLFATIFIIFFVRQLILIYDIDLVNHLAKTNLMEEYGEISEKFGEERLTLLTNYINVSPFVGLIIAFIISSLLTIKRKQFWPNSLLVFIVCYSMLLLRLHNNRYVIAVFLYPGTLVIKHGIIFSIITNVTLFFSAASYLLFGKIPERFSKNLPIHKNKSIAFDDINES